MSLNRFNAIDIIQNRLDIEMPYSTSEEKKISSFYGENVFNDESMKKYLSESAYFSVKAAIQSGTNLNKEVASSVAEAMKNWAMEKGATHYAHWFQPLTGKTAEKHDSFFTITPSGKAIEEFGGKELAQQEPDGSSFPGGGLRSTFEARGYTSWDPSSPAFILEVGDGMTLCIPTIFVTYGGEALDFKLPLLKSVSYLETSALEVCKMFDEKVERVHTTLGWEQEYFLIDESFFLSRPDLMMTGRTILGKHSNKGQQLEDHYFGSIPERVYNYMRDLETECHKLGIPVRTRHIVDLRRVGLGGLARGALEQERDRAFRVVDEDQVGEGVVVELGDFKLGGALADLEDFQAREAERGHPAAVKTQGPPQKTGACKTHGSSSPSERRYIIYNHPYRKKAAKRGDPRRFPRTALARPPQYAFAKTTRPLLALPHTMHFPGPPCPRSRGTQRIVTVSWSAIFPSHAAPSHQCAMAKPP